MNKYLHILRLIYFGVVPIVAGLAVVAAHPEGPTGMEITMRCLGWIPGIVFVTMVITKYPIPNRIWRSLLIALLVPVEIFAAWMWFEQPVAEFFLETALIEMGGFIFGLALTMLLYKPSGVYGVIVGLLLAAIAYWSWGDPLLDKYTQGGYAWYWWLVLAVSLLSSIWTHMISLLPEAAIAVNKPLPRFLDWSDGLDSSPFEGWRFLPVVIGGYPFLWIIIFLTPLGGLLAKLIFAPTALP